MIIFCLEVIIIFVRWLVGWFFGWLVCHNFLSYTFMFLLFLSFVSFLRLTIIKGMLFWRSQTHRSYFTILFFSETNIKYILIMLYTYVCRRGWLLIRSVTSLCSLKSVCWTVRLSYFPYTRGKLHFHAPIGSIKIILTVRVFFLLFFVISSLKSKMVLSDWFWEFVFDDWKKWLGRWIGEKLSFEDIRTMI